MILADTATWLAQADLYLKGLGSIEDFYDLSGLLYIYDLHVIQGVKKDVGCRRDSYLCAVKPMPRLR